MEDEYHDNIRFGLSDAADTVSNLLEWYRDYRTRLARGGTMYANKSEAPKEDPAIAQVCLDSRARASGLADFRGVQGAICGDVALWSRTGAERGQGALWKGRGPAGGGEREFSAG
jgi:hypothetical protein